MRNEIAEYAPQANEGLGQSNHKEKTFELVRSKDPTDHLIIRAREDAVTDPELTDGARNLFTFLLDLANNPYVNGGRKGQITISNTQLRARLKRSSRAIYGWTKELVEQRHIWVTKFPRPNMHPMNVFHITAQQPKREICLELPGDGLWGNGYRRPDQVMPLGARGGTCTKRHYLLDAFGAPLYAQTLENRAPTRTGYTSPPQNLRGVPAQNDTCPPQNLRGDTAKLAGATRTKQHLAPAQNDTTPPQKPALLRESQIEKESTLETSLSVQRGHAFKKGGENGYLLHVLEVLSARSPREAKLELTNSGAWWRLKYREDADKAYRVLAEIKRMITESVPFTNNPGACAVDLWSRFV